MPDRNTNYQTQSPDYFTRLAGKVEQSLDQSSSRIADKLAPVMHSGTDQGNISTADYHNMIRQNWSDPQWRAEQAFQRGPVKFAQDAVQAFGLPKSALSDNAEAIVQGLNSHAVDHNTTWQQALPDHVANGTPAASLAVAQGGTPIHQSPDAISMVGEAPANAENLDASNPNGQDLSASSGQPVGP